MEIEIESFPVNQSIQVLLQSICQKIFEALFPILQFKINISEKLWIDSFKNQIAEADQSVLILIDFLL